MGRKPATPERPAYLSSGGLAFRDRDVARAYVHRPPYPASVITRLRRLASGRSGAVLELGAGLGELARALAPHVERVVAVEPSQEMHEVGRGLPGGARPNLEWVLSTAEDFAFEDRYALAVAADSIHWMNWDRFWNRLADALATVEGRLAVVEGRMETATPWTEAAWEFWRRNSAERAFVPFDPVAELERSGRFAPEARHVTAPVEIVQSVDEYIERCHSQAGGARVRLGENVERFDAELRALLARYAVDGRVRFPVRVSITSGRALRVGG